MTRALKNYGAQAGITLQEYNRIERFRHRAQSRAAGVWVSTEEALQILGKFMEKREYTTLVKLYTQYKNLN